MPGPRSKPPRTPGPGRWRLAYALAALVLAGSLILVWALESHRPWQEEVRSINDRRAAQVEAALLAQGATPQAARAAALEVAQAPPRVVEIVPRATGQRERCLTCHQGIEEISPSHPVEAVGCVVCHGGQGLGLTKAQAHRGLLGRNPSRPEVAALSCGGGLTGTTGCHAGRENPAANMVARVERTIMATMTGVITSLRVSWGAQDDFGARFAARAVSDPGRPSPPPAQSLAGLLALPGGPPAEMSFPGLADEHWRKFCARCHLNAAREAGLSAHGAGCAACHGARAPDGRYAGGDPTIDRAGAGHAARHRLAPVPEEANCRRCHNRSGRIGLNYRGLMEDESGRPPWPRAEPGYTLSGGRGTRQLLPDAHAEKGMGCIDCHTPAEIMGDGRLYGRMRFQTEVRCASCHGAPGQPVELAPPDDRAAYETAYGPLKAAPALTPVDRLAVSAKGRPLAGVRRGGDGLALWLRTQPGQTRPCRSIADDPMHTIPGHGRLKCSACHSRWTPQCYGCHDYRRQDGALWDFAADRPTPGRWQETRDLYRFREPILALHDDGRIGPVVPGCQVLLSVLDGQGRPKDGISRRILRQGTPAGNGIVFTPLAPHTTRREAPACEGCHLSPRRLGLGGGPRPLGSLTGQGLADLTSLGWPADWETLVDQEGNPLQGTTHHGARPLNRAELARVLRFAACLPCHRKPQDPVVRDPAKAYARIAPGGDHAAKHQAQVAKALR